jgi:hypothetical protein
VDGIVKVVLIVHVVDIDVVVVAPRGRPWVSDVERVSAVLEPGPALEHLGAMEAEVVFAAEVLMEVLLRDAAVISGGTSLRAIVVLRARMIVVRLTVAIFLGAALLIGLRRRALLLNFLVLLRLVLLGFASVLLVLLRPMLVILSGLGVFLRALLFCLLRVVVLLRGLTLRLWVFLLRMFLLSLWPLALGMFRLRFFLTGMFFRLLGKSTGRAES